MTNCHSFTITTAKQTLTSISNGPIVMTRRNNQYLHDIRHEELQTIILCWTLADQGISVFTGWFNGQPGEI